MELALDTNQDYLEAYLLLVTEVCKGAQHNAADTVNFFSLHDQMLTLLGVMLC
ncbi:hypothetical protein [Neobacillus cucumis]|uniref:hypothetical protein n=1 Tax=Neobacillus cucumis TaxID=1740721 RepID=UPI0015E0EB48|nr:hypothetical protein [Neobacillus cucumis]